MKLAIGPFLLLTFGIFAMFKEPQVGVQAAQFEQGPAQTGEYRTHYCCPPGKALDYTHGNLIALLNRHPSFLPLTHDLGKQFKCKESDGSWSNELTTFRDGKKLMIGNRDFGPVGERYWTTTSFMETEEYKSLDIIPLDLSRPMAPNENIFTTPDIYLDLGENPNVCVINPLDTQNAWFLFHAIP